MLPSGFRGLRCHDVYVHETRDSPILDALFHALALPIQLPLIWPTPITTTLSRQGYGVSNDKVYTSTGFPIVQIPILLLVGSCPPLWRCRPPLLFWQLFPTNRCFADRDFKVHKSLVYGIPDFSMNQVSMVPDPLPRVLPDGRFRLTLGILRLSKPWFSWPRELRFPDDHYADSLWISDTCPIQMDGLD
jgi:hypothetical protein